MAHRQAGDASRGSARLVTYISEEDSMLALMLGFAVTTFALGALSKYVPSFLACAPGAGRPTARDQELMKRRFAYPSTTMLATALLLGSAWAVMRALGFDGLLRQIAGTWCAVIAVVAVAVKFLENCFDILGGIFGFGPHRIEELKAHAKIEACEKKYGYAPAHYFGRLGGDFFGLFWTRKDGSRNRML